MHVITKKNKRKPVVIFGVDGIIIIIGFVRCYIVCNCVLRIGSFLSCGQLLRAMAMWCESLAMIKTDEISYAKYSQTCNSRVNSSLVVIPCERVWHYRRDIAPGWSAAGTRTGVVPYSSLGPQQIENVPAPGIALATNAGARQKRTKNKKHFK